jgi:hypothetical protein
VHIKMAVFTVQAFRKYWTQKLAALKSECHAIAEKYSEAASVVQQVYTVLSDTENSAGCTPAKVRESSEWNSIPNSAEGNRVNFCKALDGRPVYSALYGMYTVTPNELKAVLKVSAQEVRSVAVNKTSVEPTAQDDDFQEVKRRKRNIFNNSSQTAKNSTEPVPTSVSVKMPPKAVLNCNFFTPFRTTAHGHREY